jgi:hypothetical protein
VRQFGFERTGEIVEGEHMMRLAFQRGPLPDTPRGEQR